MNGAKCIRRVKVIAKTRLGLWIVKSYQWGVGLAVVKQVLYPGEYLHFPFRQAFDQLKIVY